MTCCPYIHALFCKTHKYFKSMLTISFKQRCWVERVQQHFAKRQIINSTICWHWKRHFIKCPFHCRNTTLEGTVCWKDYSPNDYSSLCQFVSTAICHMELSKDVERQWQTGWTVNSSNIPVHEHNMYHVELSSWWSVFSMNTNCQPTNASSHSKTRYVNHESGHS